MKHLILLIAGLSAAFYVAPMMTLDMDMEKQVIDGGPLRNRKLNCGNFNPLVTYGMYQKLRVYVFVC